MVSSMGVSPPYLHDDTVRGSGVVVDTSEDVAVPLLTVHGQWDAQLCLDAAVTLRRCFTEQPDGLIVDLSGLHDPHSESAPVWTTARQVAAGLEPPIHLALCVPPDLPLADRMQSLGVGRYLPVYAKVGQARVALAGRIPGEQRLTATLQPDPEAPSLARNLVSDACLGWGLTHLLHRCRLVMSELVTNALEHAGTEIRVAVHRRGSGLHLSVTDGDPRLPRMVPVSRPRPDLPLDERGRGLRTVQQTASRWGAVPIESGKVVWATILSNALFSMGAR
ncbi:anti-sigma regulatory factor (Ser/Thr protein kinase) [Actinoplanes italicus]|uniref:Anti-sigma regulatory factor (Ser/Thr protein kinase) n=1 Tax=Actinoplanes italicus TaxID=113567 RepID=A0A2T0KLF5_9ACTN|nr:anti-sigma regulatory factor (Ser/Thr protein kinase) [Actinoplanes italicus]